MIRVITHGSLSSRPAFLPLLQERYHMGVFKACPIGTGQGPGHHDMTKTPPAYVETKHVDDTLRVTYDYLVSISLVDWWFAVSGGERCGSVLILGEGGSSTVSCFISR